MRVYYNGEYVHLADLLLMDWLIMWGVAAE